PLRLTQPPLQRSAELSSSGSQRCHRIHTSGATRRQETSKKRRTSEHQACADERQRIGRTYLVQDFGQDPPCTQRKNKSDADGKSRLHCCLSHDKAEYVAPMCS